MPPLKLRVPVNVEGHELVVSASMGVSLLPDNAREISALVSQANMAMQHAKHLGGNNFQFFTDSLQASTLERLQLENHLRKAIDERQLTVFYQPKLCLATGKLKAAEALVRWEHPQWGMVPPSQFIPVAEDAGLIHELTLWLLDEACRQLAAWRAAGHDVPCVAVNLSGRSFHRPEFAQEISNALQRHGLRASDVLLEITESVMMDARPVTLQNIEALHHQGFKLSLDDFGTGYSSLSYLHRLPISELKLDMAFVQDLTTSATARARRAGRGASCSASTETCSGPVIVSHLRPSPVKGNQAEWVVKRSKPGFRDWSKSGPAVMMPPAPSPRTIHPGIAPGCASGCWMAGPRRWPITKSSNTS